MSRCVIVVAGEVSGDMHAASLVRAVRERDPTVSFFGMGGDRLREAGMEILYDCREMAVFGLPEVLKRYSFFRRVFDDMVGQARARQPDAALLVDYGGFNLRYARRLKELGIKVIYFICPQVWASRRSRMRRIVHDVNRLLVIFPFERELFAGSGLRVDFVGHPLVDEAARARAEPEADLPWTGATRVALLPGSRGQEITRILPVMLGAARQVENAVKGATFIIAVPPGPVAELARETAAENPGPANHPVVVAGGTRQVLRQARAAMVASGTATIEAALMRCPMLVVYRTSPLIYALARLMIRVPHIGMVNLVAGRLLCPEFIQGRATAKGLAEAVKPLLAETGERQAMLQGLDEVVQRLGEGGAASRAAEIVLQELGAA